MPCIFSNSLLGYLILISPLGRARSGYVCILLPSAGVGTPPPNSRSLHSDTNGKISQGVGRILAPDGAGESHRTASSSSSVGVFER